MQKKYWNLLKINLNYKKYFYNILIVIYINHLLINKIKKFLIKFFEKKWIFFEKCSICLSEN